MGIDLRLLPVDALRIEAGWGFSHTILPLPRHYDLFDAIRALDATPLGLAKVSSYVGRRVPDGTCEGEPTYGELTTDAYGKPYSLLRAAQLAPVLREHIPDDPATAFVAACDPDRWIVLDWH